MIKGANYRLEIDFFHVCLKFKIMEEALME